MLCVASRRTCDCRGSTQQHHRGDCRGDDNHSNTGDIWGGYTIAEDESTAVVYGMPAEAVRLGAVSESLPLPAIAPRILELTLCKQEVG